MSVKRNTVKHISSYSVEISHNLNALKDTVDYYREAVKYLLLPVMDHRDEIRSLETAQERQRFVECLVHGTKKQKAVYDFDAVFYKFPSYLRRCAITAAVGAVMSWMSNHENWVNEGKKGNEPKLGVSRDECPCFYSGNMFLMGQDNTAMIKLYVNHDWVWRTVRLKKTDVSYLEKRRKVNKDSTISSPVIEKKPKGHFFLRFSLEETVELSSMPIFDQKVCAVDLGLNTDAVCSVIDVHGTVLSRAFIDLGREKDQVQNALHRVSVFQRLHGSHDSGRLWSVAKRRNENLGDQVAHNIVEFARANDCDVIVFEHLQTKGKKHGSKKQRLSMWKHRDIQKTAESLAHKYGIRISRVCAWNTSKLAYDGSGPVKRGRQIHEGTPYDICRFSNGKIYNSNLSASYNIGARYFIRELNRELTFTEVPDIMAEVPDIGSGTRRTLSHLWQLDKVMDVL